MATLTYYHPSMFCGMGLHGGSISLPVDMSVIAQATRLGGADMLRSPVPSSGFTIVAVVAGEQPRASALRERYAAAVVDLPPDDLLLSVRTALSRDELPLEYLLACLRVTRYDPIALALVSEKLAAALPPAEEHRAELVRVLERISELDFSITNQGDVPYAVATLLGRAGEFDRAVEHFGRARARYGPRPQTLYGEAMCHFGLDHVDEGVAALEACLAFDPSFAPARQLLERVRAGDLTPPSGPLPARS
jgi:tetratricopeptide (TPR) repeat protein